MRQLDLVGVLKERQMVTFRAGVHVTLRPGIADPQGLTIERALPALGFEGVSGVRVGKLIQFELDAADAREAESKVRGMCEQLLANTVIESYTWEITEAVGAGEGS